MITLHHLDQSRSFRILWLLEEIKQPYELKRYYRDSSTHLAPDSLKTIHPLGKSPVLEWDGKVIAESGAIVELLIQKLAPHLAPDMDEPTYVDYLQWIHFSESSAMLPFLLKTFNAIETKQGTKLVFLENYTQVEFDKVFGHLNEYLKDKEFLVADRLPGFISTLLKKRIRMQGFIIFDDYGSQYPEFYQQMSEWLKDGKIKYKEHMVQGLDNTINAFNGMLKGENFGKVVVKI